MWVFILQQVTDTLGDTTCSPSQRVTFSQLYSWDSLGTWQMKLGHSRSDCWLWALPSAPGQSKGFQMPVTDALHAKDLHHEIATYSGKELYLFIFFFHMLYFCGIFFHSVFYGCICWSHGANISFSVFHWEWQKKSAAAADVFLKYKFCFDADAFSSQEWI